MLVSRAVPRLTVCWFLALPFLVLGPVLIGRGFPLSYDMVWVPDLAWRPDLFGTGSGWPRAVPSDAVVATLGLVVPGELLAKSVLYLTLAAAGVGAARLGPGSSALGPLVAGTAYVWNPFVAERLLIGHWPVLVGYAALPWLAAAAWRVHQEGRIPPALLAWLVVGSLSASAGLVSAAVALALGVRRRRRPTLLLVLAVLAANAPWLVTGLLHAGTGTDSLGVRAFAAHSEGTLPAPLATLALGGIWNDSVVPGSRQGLLAVGALLVLVTVAAVGAGDWWRAQESRWRLGLIACAAGAWAISLLGWAFPAPMAAAVDRVAVLGLFRDGARYLAPLALLASLLLAHGARRVVRRSGDAAGLVAVVAVLLPVLFLPDLAWGAWGTLRPAEYPAVYERARIAIDERSNDASEAVLLLPFTSYRAPSWNHDRPVLDPLGRYLPQNTVASDVLFVSGRSVAGEDPVGPRVVEALARSEPEERARSLRALGVRFVATDADRPVSPTVAGEVLIEEPELHLVDLGPVHVAPSTLPRRLAIWLGWAGFAALVPLAGIVALRGSRRNRRTPEEAATEAGRDLPAAGRVE